MAFAIFSSIALSMVELKQPLFDYKKEVREMKYKLNIPWDEENQRKAAIVFFILLVAVTFVVLINVLMRF